MGARSPPMVIGVLGPCKNVFAKEADFVFRPGRELGSIRSESRQELRFPLARTLVEVRYATPRLLRRFRCTRPKLLASFAAPLGSVGQSLAFVLLEEAVSRSNGGSRTAVISLNETCSGTKRNPAVVGSVGFADLLTPAVNGSIVLD